MTTNKENAMDNAKDSDVYVRRGAAENPSCPAEVLAALAGVSVTADTDRPGGAS